MRCGRSGSGLRNPYREALCAMADEGAGAGAVVCLDALFTSLCLGGDAPLGVALVYVRPAFVIV